jgi:glycosyltransferase involved in cell wall biosynthesis
LTPLISIVTPCFNKGNFIEQTIESVLHQSYKNWELLLIDDASTDHSHQILSSYSQQYPKIKTVLNSINRGGNFCRNQGIEMAAGRYLLFLDADDLLAPNCLQQRIETALNNLNAHLWIFAMGAFFKEIGDAPKSTFWKPVKGDYLSAFLSHELPWSICQPLWDIEFLRTLNGFDADFQRLQDVEFHTRALLKGARIHISENQVPDCFYRIDNNRNSENEAIQLRKKTDSAIQYYQKFFPVVSKAYQAQLTGTLIESMGTLFFANRSGQISRDEVKILAESVIRTCCISSHRRYLSAYFNIDRNLPFHPRGLKFLIRKAAGN